MLLEDIREFEQLPCISSEPGKVAEDQRVDVSPPDVIQHPHLSLAQIHAGLAYYYDHKEVFDMEIQKSLQEYHRACRSRRKPTAKTAARAG